MDDFQSKFNLQSSICYIINDYSFTGMSKYLIDYLFKI